MAPLQQLAGILGLSFASGVNLYLAVLAVGMAERYHWVTGLPPELGILAHPVVLAVAGLLFLLEFFADKIPFVTVVWDAIHTFIRPVGGALLALGAAGHLDPTLQAAAALVGGSIALGAHGTKMGVRILAHAAPEPATHSVASLVEDVGVVGLLSLVYLHPYVALPVLAALLLLVALVLPLVLRVLNLLLAGLAGWIRTWIPGSRPGALPRWAHAALLDLDPDGPDWVGEAFARKAKGAPQLKSGFLARMPHQWVFVHRGLFKAKVLRMDEGQRRPRRLLQRLLWDSLEFTHKGGVSEFLLPKDASARLPLSAEQSG